MHVHIAFKDAIKAACVDPETLKAMFGKTEEQLINANATGEYVKMSFVIARPFIEHRMMSAIMAVAGTDTGATLFGPADMQISANTSVKTIEGCVFAPSRDTRCPAPRYVRLLTEQPLPRQALHVRRFCKRFSRWHRLRLRPAHTAPFPSGATRSR